MDPNKFPSLSPSHFPAMSLQTIQNLIDRADQCYFYTGVRDRVMPDETYDALKAELKVRDPHDPRLTRVGAPIPPEGQLENRRHSIPMDSLENKLNLEEFAKWIGKPEHRGFAFSTSYKMDGASVGLTLVRGKLTQAITRGDGVIGEDITANAACIEGIPHNVTDPSGHPFTGYVRGEVILPYDRWKIVDPHQEGNPRNIGNGILRRKNGQDADLLKFYAFRLYDANGKPMGATETEMLAIAAAMGFTPVPNFGPYGYAEVESLYNLMVTTLREKLEYDIDGLVIKMDNLEAQLALGSTNHHPRAQIALKFPPAGAVTTLREVEVNLGYTGALTPVAIFDPVRLLGVEVNRATLCNWDEIARLGIAVGDQIRVTRQADCIPKVIAKVTDGENRVEIKEPTKCPITGGPVGRIENVDGSMSATLYSLEANNCTAVKIARLHRWVKELDIQGLGDANLEALHNTKDSETGLPLVDDPADLYTLRDRGVKWLKTEDGKTTVIGPLTMRSILNEIDQKREIPLSQFIAAIGVHGLGRSRVDKIRQAMPGEFDTLNDWCTGKLVLNADKIGAPNTAAKYDAGIKKMLPLIARLQTVGVHIVEEKTQSDEGKLVFCLTGDFPHPKDYYHAIISRFGHLFAQSFSKKVTHVVTMNPNATTGKAKKAREKNIPIISPEQLMVILGEESAKQELEHGQTVPV